MTDQLYYVLPLTIAEYDMFRKAISRYVSSRITHGELRRALTLRVILSDSYLLWGHSKVTNTVVAVSGLHRQYTIQFQINHDIPLVIPITVYDERFKDFEKIARQPARL